MKVTNNITTTILGVKAGMHIGNIRFETGDLLSKGLAFLPRKPTASSHCPAQ
ncbi:hypothetical protein HCU01_00360 [Halomonas cupida]|uniref:Uncharacterized protein n=1 Tax=Halomonas cupida TaxID=44933 RepID=A0ABQ0WB16_9GAMM|nr:hypothetical protein HCU01_00360 [Halomonas cupida]